LGAESNPALAAEMARARISVNDLVREELKDTLARRDLSAQDRRRLDMHFTSIRDLEIKIAANSLSQEQIAAMKSVDGDPTASAVRLQVERMHMDLIGLAFASGYTQAATLQSGEGTDKVQHLIDGKVQPPFHFISHRATSDSANNDGTIPDAILIHHKIDRIN